MNNLWTPWRIEHVLGSTPAQQGCLFEPPGDICQDKDSLLLFRDDLTVVLLNRFPYTNGHLLVAPRRHVACITELEVDQYTALMLMVKQSAAIAKEIICCDGLNIGCNIGEVAGAGIADHVHIHIVPRWSGDHNFMTVVGEIRTIPEHIEKTFDKLLPPFKAIHTR